MYQSFDLLGINTSLKDKKVYIECTLNADETTVTSDTITLAARDSNRILNYDLSVNGSIIELDLKEWPVPNIEYILVVQTGIKSITGEPLTAALKRMITFPSEITSTIVITSPSHHEEIHALKLAWTEKLTEENMEPVNSYYIEVAQENAFYNIIKATNVYEKNQVNLVNIPEGQYYVRIRAQKNDKYGCWSETITFLYKEVPNAPVPNKPEEDPIYGEKLVVVTAPANGETPNSFLIEFDEILDTEGLEIIVTRRTL
jgi:hypothetical protein